MPIQRKTVHLMVPADAEYVDVIRLVLYGITAKMGFPFEDIDDMKIAVSEACNNAALHAYSDMNLGYIDIDFQICEDRVDINIKDSGNGFDINEVWNKSNAHHDKQLSEIEVGGLGIYLMNSLMDDVKVENEGGTNVFMSKWLKPNVQELDI